MLLLHEAYEEHHRRGRPARRFRDFYYRTRKSWSRSRRVVGKAEYLAKGANPRFVVTNLPAARAGAKRLYERLYCSRGDIENRIKEQQLGLFADRASAATLRANQLRLYFASFAYVLLHALRRLGLKGSALAHAQCTTIRLKLLKIGARLKITVRKVWLSFFYIDKSVPVDIIGRFEGGEPFWRYTPCRLSGRMAFFYTYMVYLAAQILEMREFKKVEFIGRVHVQVRGIIQQVFAHGRV